MWKNERFEKTICRCFAVWAPSMLDQNQVPYFLKKCKNSGLRNFGHRNWTKKNTVLVQHVTLCRMELIFEPSLFSFHIENQDYRTMILIWSIKKTFCNVCEIHDIGTVFLAKPWFLVTKILGFFVFSIFHQLSPSRKNIFPGPIWKKMIFWKGMNVNRSFLLS